MRHAIRIQPYVSVDLFQKLRGYAAAHSLTVSAVIGAALTKYFERDEVEDALLVRRLDSVTHAVGQLQRDVDTLAAGFGRFVRYSFLSAPATAGAEIVGRADVLYGEFLGRVAEQLREGVKFTGQVWRVRTRSSVAPGLPAAKTGGRDEEGR